MLLPSPEETRLPLEFSDGQEPITLDVMDIDTIVNAVWTNKVPEDSDFEAEFCKLFKQKYQRTISKAAATLLYTKSSKILNGLKKKSSLLDEPSDSSPPERT